MCRVNLARALGCSTILAVASFTLGTAAAGAGTAPIVVQGTRVFPESLTSDAAVDVIFGMTTLKDGEPGLTAVTMARGKIWVLNAELAYRDQPDLKDKDPGIFSAEALDIPAR